MSHGSADGRKHAWEYQSDPLSRIAALFGAAPSQQQGSSGSSGGGSGDFSRENLDPNNLIPQPIDSQTSETGIVNPNENRVPNSQGHMETQTLAELGQGAADSFKEAEGNRVEAETIDADKATDLSDEVRSDKEDTTAAIDETRLDLAEDAERVQEGIEKAKENLDQIPGEITAEFDRLHERFGAEADASFDRIESYREEALGEAMKGRAQAMEAAVMGTQGQIRTQVSQINANPNLTQAQKASMIAQVKMAGAASIGPQIGQTVLAFNTLSADIATKFGGIVGSMESNITSVSGQLTGLQGQAFAQAQIAVGQMTNQLLEIDANSSVAFAQVQAQLLGTRAHAINTSNDILLRTLPAQNTPWFDPTGAAIAAYDIGTNIVMQDWQMRMGESAVMLQMAMLKSQEGSMWDNIIAGALAGGQAGGFGGAVLGAIGGFMGSQGPSVFG